MGFPVVHEDDGDYLALVEVFHSAKQEYYGAGSHINLDHLDDKQRNMLIGRKIVRHDPDREGLAESDRYELQEIHGISAAKAHTLSRLGITTKREFAEMDDEMTEQAAESLGVTKDKIETYQDRARKSLGGD
jgi:predicted flap endonuclease-1-like 5' DNA nuclease